MQTHVHKDNEGTYWWITSENKIKPYLTGQVWEDLRSNAANVGWCDVIWFPQYTPKHAFICWLAVQQRLTTQDRLKVSYPNEVFICSLCGKHEDSHPHLFFKCEFSSQVWENTKKMLVYKGLHNDLGLIVNDFARYPARKDIRNILNKIAVAATVYYVWMERNKIQFLKLKKSVDAVSQEVKDFIRVKLTSLKVKSSKNIGMIAGMCNLKVVGCSLQLDFSMCIGDVFLWVCCSGFVFPSLWVRIFPAYVL
ncbi:uncharacterized protein [Rutidosis leptorrhynchoides]|uniref:uncharacterized protein n=1 Tax=Rutidosis leptorrhynchoides TaxID=125765 RepID=UPI003A99B243